MLDDAPVLRIEGPHSMTAQSSPSRKVIRCGVEGFIKAQTND